MNRKPADCSVRNVNLIRIRYIFSVKLKKIICLILPVAVHVLFTKFNVKKRLDDRFVILTVHKIILTFVIAMHCFIVFALKEKTLKVKLKFATECQNSQGHPTSIFGKYLFGRRFEI